MKDKDKLPDWFINCFGKYEDFKEQVKTDIKNNNFILKCSMNFSEKINIIISLPAASIMAKETAVSPPVRVRSPASARVRRD